MEAKYQTLIILENGWIAKRLDFIYQPLGSIIINDKEWRTFIYYDEFIGGSLIRKIILKT